MSWRRFRSSRLIRERSVWGSEEIIMTDSALKPYHEFKAGVSGDLGMLPADEVIETYHTEPTFGTSFSGLYSQPITDEFVLGSWRLGKFRWGTSVALESTHTPETVLRHRHDVAVAQGEAEEGDPLDPGTQISSSGDFSLNVGTATGKLKWSDSGWMASAGFAREWEYDRKFEFTLNFPLEDNTKVVGIANYQNYLNRDAEVYAAWHSQITVPTFLGEDTVYDEAGGFWPGFNAAAKDAELGATLVVPLTKKSAYLAATGSSAVTGWGDAENYTRAWGLKGSLLFAGSAVDAFKGDYTSRYGFGGITLGVTRTSGVTTEDHAWTIGDDDQYDQARTFTSGRAYSLDVHITPQVIKPLFPKAGRMDSLGSIALVLGATFGGSETTESQALYGTELTETLSPEAMAQVPATFRIALKGTFKGNTKK